LSTPFRVPLSGHVRLRLETRSGRVLVTAEQREDLQVEEGLRSPEDIERDGPELTLKSGGFGSKSLQVRCPEGTDLVISSLSGQVDVRGRAGAVLVSTASASIEVERALTADLRTLSGTIGLGACSGRCRLRTKSGKVRVGATGQADVATVSGSITVTRAAGDVAAKTVSGNVQVEALGAHDLAVRTVSGGISVTFPRAVHPNARIRVLSGRPRVECAAGHDCAVDIVSVSGRVEVVPER
jgi:DUF4097 and DUF4098 domain-containing protein YvlB